MRSKSESGITHIILLLLVMGIVAAATIAGLRVMEKQNTGESSSAAPLASTADSEAINNSADLQKTEATLNKTNIDGDLNPDDLNDDIDSVL